MRRCAGCGSRSPPGSRAATARPRALARVCRCGRSRRCLNRRRRAASDSGGRCRGRGCGCRR
ncbi:MAG: hypothetical protein EGQ99_09245 [Porphyromonadaceae bacterium]|nr:hypothetical protein [Porphyromonadaceae bacterium]